LLDFTEKSHDEFKKAHREGRVVLNIMPRSWSWLTDYVPPRRIGNLFSSSEKRLLARMYNDERAFYEVQSKGVDIGFKA